MACSGYVSQNSSVFSITDYNFTNYNFTDFVYNNTDDDPIDILYRTAEILGWVTFAIELPAVLIAMYGLFRLIKSDHVAPVYIMNLLLSDLIQVVLRPFFMSYNSISSTEILVFIIHGLMSGHPPRILYDISMLIFYFGIVANIGFMVCISLERYLLVVHPLWYHCRRTIKHSVLVSLAVWVTAIIYIAQQFIHLAICKEDVFSSLITVVSVAGLILFPFPSMLFFFVATWRALSQSILVSAVEKRKILGTLLLILGIYTILFIPSLATALLLKTVIFDLHLEFFEMYMWLDTVSMMLLFLSPLMDTLLYIFMRNSPIDTLKIFPCCKRETQSLTQGSPARASGSDVLAHRNNSEVMLVPS